jgi:hypothetical protein
MSWFQSLFFLIIAGTASLNVLCQEPSTDKSKLTAQKELRLQHLFAGKSIDIKTFEVNSLSDMSSLELRTLNLSQVSPSKQLIADQPVELPKSAKPVPNRLGSIEPLKIKSAWAKGIEQNRVSTLRSFDVLSSRQRDLSDVK